MNPFLQLDALRQARNTDFRKRHEDRLREFGQAPLTAQSLMQEFEDRQTAASERMRKSGLEREQMDVTKGNAERMRDWTEAQTENMQADNTRHQKSWDEEQAEKELQSRLRSQRTAAESAALPFVAGTAPEVAPFTSISGVMKPGSQPEKTPEELKDEEAIRSRISGATDAQEQSFVERAKNAGLFPDLTED